DRDPGDPDLPRSVPVLRDELRRRGRHGDLGPVGDQHLLLPAADVEVVLLMRTPRLNTAFTYLLVIVTLAVLLFPIYWMIVTAVRPGNELLSYPPKFLPTDGSLGVFLRVLRDSDIFRWFANS